MSTAVPDAPPAVHRQAPEPIACPRCGAEVRGDQGWCLDCGLAARTRMAPAPDWHVPTFVAAGVGLAAIVALIVAFLVLTGHNQPVAPAATAPATPTSAPDTTAIPTTSVPVATAPAATPPATTTPAATAPPATTPAATTPAPPTATATTP